MISINAPDSVLGGTVICVMVSGTSMAEVKAETPTGMLAPTVESLPGGKVKVSVRAPRTGSVRFRIAAPSGDYAVAFVKVI